MFNPCVVIPVYNHEHALPTVVERVQAFNLPCILVNDGSSDACRQVMMALSEQYELVSLVEHEVNQGKGAAVKTGFLEAKTQGFSHALQLDADGQHNISDVPIFLDLAKLHPEKIINGNAIYDDSVPKVRFYGRYLTHALVWLNTGSMTIKDSMCGFRVYPVEAALRVVQRYRVGDRMDFDTEMLVRSVWSGVETVEVPTKVHYPLDGVSHFKMFKDNMHMIFMHIRLLFSRAIQLPKQWLLGKK